MRKARRTRKVRKTQRVVFFKSMSERVRGWYLNRKFKKPVIPPSIPVYTRPDAPQAIVPKVGKDLNLRAKWGVLRGNKGKNRQEKQTPHKLKVSRQVKSRLGIVAGILAACGIAAMGLLHLQHKSRKLETSIKTAIRESDWKQVHLLLPQCDVQVYHFLNKGLTYTVNDAESWVARQRMLYTKLQQRLVELENGTNRVENLSIHAASDIERSLRALPTAINDLSGRWGTLLTNNRALLTKSRNFIINKILSAPEIHTLLSNDVQLDEEILNKHISEWDDLLETCTTYDIPKNLALRGKYYLEALQQYKSELDSLQAFYSGIDEVVTYSELIKWNKNKTPKKYLPAIRLFSFIASLPTYEQWQDKMLPINKWVAESARAAALGQFMKSAPSYSQHFPASAEQYALMDELFSAPSCQQTFYQIIYPGGKTALCNHYTVKKEGKQNLLVFKLAELDPAFSTQGNNTVVWDAASAKVRKISVSAFLHACGITREQFFTRTNLLHLLDYVSALSDADCPILAKAYIYDRIVRLIEEHPLWGKHRDVFAPRLSADIKAFALLRSKHAALLYCGAWLLPEAQTKMADKDFADWFKKHRNRDYNNESPALAAPYFKATPHYIGYIDATGKPQLRTKTPETQELWYLSPNGIRSISANQQPADAIPFSPILIDTMHR